VSLLLSGRSAAAGEGSITRGPVRVHHPGGQEAAARRVLDAFFPMRRHAASWLGVDPPESGQIHLAADFAGLTREAPGAPEWAVGVCRPDGVIVVRLDRLDTSPHTTLRRVLAHEVVHHVLVHHPGMPLPRWFEEGLCVSFAGGPFLPADARVERLAAMGRLPALEEAERAFGGGAAGAAIAYRVAEAAVRAMTARFGDDALRRLLRHTKRGVHFQTAFARATGRSVEQFEKEWRASVTPPVPWWLFILWERLDWALLAFGALLVAGGYLRWRLRRERAMRALGGDESAGESR